MSESNDWRRPHLILITFLLALGFLVSVRASDAANELSLAHRLLRAVTPELSGRRLTLVLSAANPFEMEWNSIPILWFRFLEPDDHQNIQMPGGETNDLLHGFLHLRNRCSRGWSIGLSRIK